MEFLFNNQFLFGEEILNSLHLFLGNWFDYLMIAITRLGNELFFMILFPVLYWCYDRTLALRVGAVFLITMSLSSYLKEFFNHPRPDTELLHEHIAAIAKKYTHETSPGFPSNHTVSAVSFWGALMYYHRKKIIIILCSLLILFIPYSRLYLGVHYVGDVLGGYFIGTVSLLCLIPLISMVEKNYEKVNEYMIIGSTFIIPLALSFVLYGEYVQNILGVASAFFLGSFISENFYSFNPRNGFVSSLLKIIIGLAGIFILRIGLKVILPQYPISTFARYWAIGFWISFLAPLIFSKFSMLRGE